MSRLAAWWRSYWWRVRHPVDPWRCGICGRLAELTDPASGQGYCCEEHLELAVADRSW